MHLKTIIITAAMLAIASAHAAEVDSAAITAEHNKWRAGAGVAEKLRYSPALAKSAQAWANQLQQSHHCQMEHSSSHGRYGENIYWSSALIWSDGKTELRNVTPKELVDDWGSEKAGYDYARNECTSSTTCGHYTQMVWRSTTQLGCAVAVCNDTHEQVWVCHYQPAGNISGERPY